MFCELNSKVRSQQMAEWIYSSNGTPDHNNPKLGEERLGMVYETANDLKGRTIIPVTVL
jgi:hypothetical protein